MSQEKLRPRYVPESPTTVEDLLDIFNVTNRTRGALDIFVGLQAGGLFKKRISREKALTIIENAMQNTKDEFLGYMSPTLMEAIGKTELPFPRRKPAAD